MTKITRQITFPPEDDDFFFDLQQEVRDYFKSRGETHHGNLNMYMKMALLFAVYFGVYGTVLCYQNPTVIFC